MDSNLVSIIMPTYNVGELIIDTVDSVLDQTYHNWELIIIDDNSTDGTFDILVKKYSSFKKVRLFRNSKNQGAGFSRNVGLENSNGRYIAFLDSDDLWSPEKLSVQLAFMKSKGAAISHTSYSFIDKAGVDRKGFVKVSEEVDLIKNLKGTEIGTSTAIIDSKVTGRDFRFSLIRSRQDIKLWIALLGAGYSSFGLDRPLVKYRVREGSVSSNKIKMLFVTFKVYMGIDNLSFWKKLSCYSLYVLNAIKKRRR